MPAEARILIGLWEGKDYQFTNGQVGSDAPLKAYSTRGRLVGTI